MFWPSRATAHDQMHFAFRGEFRPFDILQLIFSPVSHPHRNTTDIDWGSLVVALVFVLFWVWVLGLLLAVLVLVLCFASPINMLCFPSFYDDLGTPPTWRPHSWKKKRRSLGMFSFLRFLLSRIVVVTWMLHSAPFEVKTLSIVLFPDQFSTFVLAFEGF